MIIDLTCMWRAQPVRQSKPIRARPDLLSANPLASCSRGQSPCAGAQCQGEAGLLPAKIGFVTIIPYTHWMYFAERESAERCAAELASLDFLCGVDHRPPLGAEERTQLPALADLPDSPPQGDWLLRAAREVEVDEMIERHERLEAIVTRHGGFYDGGESGLFDPRTGEPVRQADPPPGA